MQRLVTTSIVAVVLALPATGFAAEVANRRNPYANLFTTELGSPAQIAPTVKPHPSPNVVLAKPLALPSSSSPSPTVVCGLTVVHGDSKIDPTMPHPAANANALTQSIALFPAPACQTK